MKIEHRKNNCSMGTYRMWLYGCNLFLIFVVFIFATFTWITVNESRMTLIPLDKWEPLVLLIYIGSALQLIDVLLCFYGVWQNNIQLVLLYWVLLLLLTLLDFIFGILWVFRWQLLHTSSSNFILHMISNNYNDSNLCQLWDDVQSEFSCCGVISYKDWLSVPYWCSQDLGNDTVLPRSCCHNEFSQCNSSVFSLLDENEENDADQGMIHHQSTLIIPGCNNAVLLWMHNKGGNLFLIGFCFVVLLKITFLIILRTEIKEFTMEIDTVIHRNSICVDRAFSVVERPNLHLFKYSEQSTLLDDSENQMTHQSV